VWIPKGGSSIYGKRDCSGRLKRRDCGIRSCDRKCVGPLWRIVARNCRVYSSAAIQDESSGENAKQGREQAQTPPAISQDTGNQEPCDRDSAGSTIPWNLGAI